MTIGHIIPLALHVDYTLLYIVKCHRKCSHPIWLNAQYSSTVQTLFTQTQEEDALIDTNQEAFS